MMLMGAVTGLLLLLVVVGSQLGTYSSTYPLVLKHIKSVLHLISSGTQWIVASLMLMVTLEGQQG